jgi:hypothetical protein
LFDFCLFFADVSFFHQGILEETGQWERGFVDNAVTAFRILRQNKEFIVSLCKKLFSSTHPTCETYLRNEAFLSDLNDEEALARIRFLVERGPRSWKRIAKNVTHFIGF